MRQKGKFLTFCFSLFPGAGHMYLGFMKQGVSLMILFWGVIGFSILMNIGAGMFVLPIIWCYSFFDVINKNSMAPEDFSMLEDDYLLHMDFSEILCIMKGKNRTIFASVLIIIGIGMLLSNGMGFFNAILPWSVYWRFEALFSYIPRIGIALVIIWVGMRLIQGKRIKIDTQEKERVFVKTEPYSNPEKYAEPKEEPKESWTGTVENTVRNVEDGGKTSEK